MTIIQMKSVRVTSRIALRAARLEFAGCARNPVMAALPTPAASTSLRRWSDSHRKQVEELLAAKRDGDETQPEK